MPQHETGTREEWLAKRLELLDAEKEHTRRGDELAGMRRELPWVAIDKDYRFETDEGPASLADLFRGPSQLLMYHFMFGPDYTAGCPPPARHHRHRGLPLGRRRRELHPQGAGRDAGCARGPAGPHPLRRGRVDPNHRGALHAVGGPGRPPRVTHPASPTAWVAALQARRRDRLDQLPALVEDPGDLGRYGRPAPTCGAAPAPARPPRPPPPTRFRAPYDVVVGRQGAGSAPVQPPRISSRLVTPGLFASSWGGPRCRSRSPRA